MGEKHSYRVYFWQTYRGEFKKFFGPVTRWMYVAINTLVLVFARWQIFGPGAAVSWLPELLFQILIVSIPIIVVLGLFNLIYTSFIVGKQQEVIIHDLQEQVKPKLELSYLKDHPSSKMVDHAPNGKGILLRIYVLNRCKAKGIGKVRVELIGINPVSFPFLPAEFGTMNGKSVLSANDDLFADIVTVRENKNAEGEIKYSLDLGFVDESLKQRQQRIVSVPKSLNLHVRATAETGAAADKWFRFSVRKARNSNELRFSLKEKQS